MAPTEHLALPFFDASHRSLGSALAAWVPQQQIDEQDDRAACRDWVRRLGDGGWLRYCVSAEHGGALPTLIQWKGPHPTEHMPDSGVTLQALALHGVPERARQVLRLAGVQVHAAPGSALTATLATPKGDVVLSSTPP
jgi:alkylation response protein AidB-like acyl-CoA dehydrogenase